MAGAAGCGMMRLNLERRLDMLGLMQDQPLLISNLIDFA